MMEILKLKGKPLFSKGSSKEIIMLLLTALLSVLIFCASLSYATSDFDPESKNNTLTMRHSEFDMSIFDGVNTDYRDISILKDHLSQSSSIDEPDLVREVVFFHIDSVFFLGLLIGADNALPFLLAAYYIKYALLGAFTYLLLRKRINVSAMGSLVLAVAFSVSAVALRTSLNTSMFNALVLMPLCLFLLLTYAWNGGRKLFVVSTVSLFLFCTTGIYAVILLLPLLLITGIVLTFGTLHTQFKTYLRLVFSCAVSFGMATFIFIPAILSNRFKWNFIESFKSGTVNHNLFDSLYGFMNGNIEGASVWTRFPALGLSIFVLVLVILFFVNEAIPFRFKICSGLFILLNYISIAYTGLGNIILFEGAQASFYYGRIAVIAMFLIFIAGISLRNISVIKNSQIYIPVFAIICYLIISNNSHSEVVHGTISLYFSALSAIISGVTIYTIVNNKKGASFLFMLIVLSGITFNSAFCLAPSSFPGYEIIPTTYFDNLSIDVDSYIFEGDEPQYIVAASDISEISLDSMPYRKVNTIAQFAMLNPVYIECSSSPIYYSDVTELGFNSFDITPGSPMQTVNFRVYKATAEDECYICSSYGGKCHLRVLFGDDEYTYEFEGPFLWKVELNESSYVVAMDFEGLMYGHFDVAPLIVDKSAEADFNNAIGTIRNNEINLSSSSYMKYEGIKTVITSLKYSPDYEVIYTKDNVVVDAECFNFNGYLAFKVESGGLEHQQAKIINSSYDFIIGTITTVIIIISFIIVSFMYNKKRLIKIETNELVDRDLGEQEVDKRED